jgi:hypothetical protein
MLWWLLSSVFKYYKIKVIHLIEYLTLQTLGGFQKLGYSNCPDNFYNSATYFKVFKLFAWTSHLLWHHFALIACIIIHLDHTFCDKPEGRKKAPSMLDDWKEESRGH